MASGCLSSAFHTAAARSHTGGQRVPGPRASMWQLAYRGSAMIDARNAAARGGSCCHARASIRAMPRWPRDWHDCEGHPWGSCLWRMCAPQGAPCKRAGGREVGEVRSGSTRPLSAEERAVLCAVRPCCRAARFRSPPRAERLWASSWGSATQHGAGCGVQVRRVGSRGSLEPGAMEQRALRMPSPLLLRRERVVVGRGHGQRTRERRWRGSARAAARAGKHAPIWLCARKE